MLSSVFVPVDNLDEWSDLYAKIESFGQLEDGWNSYTAKRPSRSAINNSRELCNVLRVAQLKPSRVGPSAVGGIGVTFRRGNRKVYVECLNTGRTFVLFSDEMHEPITSEEHGGYRGYMELVGEIRKYLNV